MRPVQFSVGPLVAAAANNISLSQTPGAAGALLLNGSLVSSGVAVLDKPRRILFTFAADETGHSFVVIGTNWSGDTFTETVAGTTAGTVATVLSYKTITSITISAAATGALTVGTNGVADSQWVRLDEWAPGPVALSCVVTGTVNYDIETSMDDPNSPTNVVAPASMTWIDSLDTGVVGATGTKQSNFQNAPIWVRLHLNSGSGSVVGTISQLSNAPF